ncbi:MAG: helix-turn-helix domain-containing protein [Bacteroidia bacterium]
MNFVLTQVLTQNLLTKKRTMDNYRKKIVEPADRILYLRKQLKMSRDKFAALLDLSASYIQALENPDPKVGRPLNEELYARFIEIWPNITHEWFFFGAGENPKIERPTSKKLNPWENEAYEAQKKRAEEQAQRANFLEKQYQDLMNLFQSVTAKLGKLNLSEESAKIFHLPVREDLVKEFALEQQVANY